MKKGGKKPCWNNYKMVGMKSKNGKMVPNCVATGGGKYGKKLSKKRNKKLSKKRNKKLSKKQKGGNKKLKKFTKRKKKKTKRRY